MIYGLVQIIFISRIQFSNLDTEEGYRPSLGESFRNKELLHTGDGGLLWLDFEHQCRSWSRNSTRTRQRSRRPHLNKIDGEIWRKSGKMKSTVKGNKASWQKQQNPQQSSDFYWLLYKKKKRGKTTRLGVKLPGKSGSWVGPIITVKTLKCLWNVKNVLNKNKNKFFSPF